MRALLLGLLGAGAVFSCSPEAAREDARSSAQRILGGDADTTTHAVVAILITKPGRTPFTWCSGVVVSPHVVVTAAHCVDPAELDAGSVLSIWIGDVFQYGVTKTSPDTTFSIRSTRMVDGFSIGTAPTEGRDLGVAITDAALPVAPLSYQHAALDASVVGQSARLVGFGDSADTMPITAGTRHEILLPVTKLDASYLVEEGEAGSTCEGDSGGATFLPGADVVVGIHAANVGLSCTGGTNYDTRLDLYAASFLDPIVAAAESDAGSEGGVPEDAGADDAGAPSPSADSGSSSCNVGRGRGAPWLTLLALAALRRRRRRTTPRGA
ncbi:MAG TPA: trypsin-like serine protease [Labilithrix sp.]